MQELPDSAASSRHIFAAVGAVLADMGLQKDELTAIAYGRGPGSFTGVRVAASAAQGLAYARSLPVAGVSSLQALAHHVAGLTIGDRIAACLDARMQEAYVGIYELVADGVLENIAPDSLVQPDHYRLAASYPDVLAAGPGWAAYPDMLDGFKGHVDYACQPDALAILQAAGRLYAEGKLIAAHEALPNYVRDKVTHQK